MNSILQALLACPPFYNFLHYTLTENKKELPSFQAHSFLLSFLELIKYFDPFLTMSKN
jgi:hypothetical protein